jgi:REase_DpnII-MboI
MTGAGVDGLFESNESPQDAAAAAKNLPANITLVRWELFRLAKFSDVPFHVMIWPQSPRQQLLHELYAFNLTEEQLRDRFIAPHDEGRPITWTGRTLPGGDISYLNVGFTDHEVDEQAARKQFKEYELFKTTRNVTNDWVTKAAGSASTTRAPAEPISAVDHVIKLCRRFNVVQRQLRRRHSGRDTLEINDEYDVQDLLHALLLVEFVDVRAESWNPNYLGGASRTDFLLPDAGIVIEVKKTRPNLRDRQVGDELAQDVTRYSDPAANRGATTLVCFVHDPDGLLVNPVGLERDLALATNDRLKVIGVVG